VKGTASFKVESGSHSIIEAISDLFEGKTYPSHLPSCVRSVERINIETVRINFVEEVDIDLLANIAVEMGYRVEAGTFAPRIIDRDVIVARVGSRSDIGGRRDLYIYPFPPELDYISMYRKAVAVKRGIIDGETGKVNLEKLHKFNIEILSLVNRYIKEKYGR